MARRKHSQWKVTMFTAMVVAMNLIGITYGQWQEGLSSDVSISTGYIKPYFSHQVEVKKTKGFRNLETDTYEGSNYVELNGEIKTGKRGKFTLNYTVDNYGSLPIKFDNEAFYELNSQLFENKEGGLRILKNAPADKILYPEGHKASGTSGKGSLTLQLNPSQEAGEYEFEIEIPYKQWTDN